VEVVTLDLMSAPEDKKAFSNRDRHGIRVQRKRTGERARTVRLHSRSAVSLGIKNVGIRKKETLCFSVQMVPIANGAQWEEANRGYFFRKSTLRHKKTRGGVLGVDGNSRDSGFVVKARWWGAGPISLPLMHAGV